MPRPNPDDLTMREIVQALGITHMTLDIWRRGTRDRQPLPWHQVPCNKRHHVFIREQHLRLWLQTYRPELIARWEAFKVNLTRNTELMRRRKSA